MKFKKAQEILEKMLVGHCYSRVGIGDSWDFYFDNGLYLVCQEVSSPEDGKLNRLLSQAEPSVLDGVDPE